MFTAPALAEHHTKYAHAYYSTEIDHPSAHAAHTIRRAEYELWNSLLPDDDTDFAVFTRSVQRLTGKGPRQIDSAISAIHRLKQLPFTHELQELTHRLDLTRLMAIDAALSKTTSCSSSCAPCGSPTTRWWPTPAR